MQKREKEREEGEKKRRKSASPNPHETATLVGNPHKARKAEKGGHDEWGPYKNM